MKKLLLSFATILTMGIGAASAQDILSADFDFASGNWGTTDPEVTAPTDGGNVTVTSVKFTQDEISLSFIDELGMGSYFPVRIAESNGYYKLRIYDYVEMHIEAAEGCYITGVQFMGGTNVEQITPYNVVDGITENFGAFSNGVWEAGNRKLTYVDFRVSTIDYNAPSTFDAILVSYYSTVTGAVATPVFTPESGVAVNNLVSISCATDGATIYYTTDGTEPTAESEIYSAPIAITDPVTIKAYAVKEGMTDSEIASSQFVPFDANTMANFPFNSAEWWIYNGIDMPETTNNETRIGGYTFTESNGAVTVSFPTSPQARVTYTPNLLIPYPGYFNVVAGDKYYLKSIALNFNPERELPIIYYAEGMGGSYVLNGKTWTAAENAQVKSLQFSFGTNAYIESMIVTFANTSGIEGIEADNEAPVYYNLQGVRVANPEKGIFIEVKGDKTTKVIF